MGKDVAGPVAHPDHPNDWDDRDEDAYFDWQRRLLEAHPLKKWPVRTPVS
jgi:hypothetical protein